VANVTPKKEIKQMVASQVKKMLAKGKNKGKNKGKSKGKQKKKTKKKGKSKLAIQRSVKKSAVITKKAFKAQRAAAKMAQLEHKKMASRSDLMKADDVAATAVKAAKRAKHLTAYVMECEKGKVKLKSLKNSWRAQRAKLSAIC